MQSEGEIRPVHNSVDTVNAAAAALATAQSRRRQPSSRVYQRNWAHRLGVYFCFGSQSNGPRINQAALLPEHVPQRTAEIPNHPFVAPPSSPASLMQSEPTSNSQSLSIGTPPFSPLLPNSSSPTEPPSIFAVGPYAYETQLVSPPVFSGSTTDSSTPRFTPPDSVHVTSPSSPEIPYANLLTFIKNSQNGETCEIELYPNYPDSPIGRQISPSSGYSGHMGNASSLLDRHITAAVPVADFSARLQHNDHAMDRKVSFELTVEDVARCLEKKTAISRDSATASFRFAPASSGDHKRESNATKEGLYVNEICHDLPEKVTESLSLRFPKEFKFDNVDATSVEPSVRSDWWANEKVAGLTVEPKKS